ncbi:adenylosuccinate synthase [Chloroflexota bacterium]
MPAIAVIGGQWGDEGKGKIVDLLAEGSGMVVRFSGGDNAGHTVMNPLGEFGLHLLPSGIFRPEVTCLIGNGVVVNPAVLLGEIDTLEQRGVKVSNLFISDRAHLIMPYHTYLDALEEEARGGGAIGTTRKGIGPACADKVARLGIRTGDLLDRDVFLRRLEAVLGYKNNILTGVYGVSPLSLKEVYRQYCGYADRLAPFIGETEQLISQALDEGKTVLLEGAQGTMLDLEFGTYPYVTSTSPLAAGACLGTGLSPNRLNGIVGVFKAYSTRVGGGPMPTELTDETGDRIREWAHEYGTTTGRPRRCGWFDAVVAAYSARLNGFTSVAITRFDILDILPSIKICTAYRVGDYLYRRPPASIALLEKCEPVYEEMPGWQSATDGIRRFQDLPGEAQDYLRRIEGLLGCPISLVSVGPIREQTIEVGPLY